MNLKLIFLMGFYFFTFSTLIAQSDEGYELKVKVSNIKKGEGQIRIAAYSPEQKFLGEEIAMGINTVVEKKGYIIASFSNLPYGTYALSLYHDRNNNGKLDSNFMGIPNEPYGFSNNARGMFGPPKFQEAQFEFIKDGQEIEVKVK